MRAKGCGYEDDNACLKTLHNGAGFVENSSRDCGTRGFRIYAQHGLGSRSAQHYPANFPQVQFDSVEIFAARHRPFEQALQLSVAEMRDRALFLPRPEFEID